MNTERRTVDVSFVALGEGYGGDYDPDDPDDRELFRVDVLVDAEAYAARNGYDPADVAAGEHDDVHVGQDGRTWIETKDYTTCTALPVDVDDDVRERLLGFAADKAEEAFARNGSTKRAVEALSYMDETWADPAEAERRYAQIAGLTTEDGPGL